MRGFIKTTIEEFLNEKNQNLIEVKPNRYVYHKSAPVFRDKISLLGLLPQRGDGWLTTTPIEGKAIFATNSDDPKQWFDSTYDDDVWKIDTSKLDNKWFSDPNFRESDGHNTELFIFTFGEIPLSAIELIYKGTGNSL